MVWSASDLVLGADTSWNDLDGLGKIEGYNNPWE